MADDRASERDDPGEDPQDPGERADAIPDAAGDQWKFDLDEVDEEGVVDDRDPIEPGSPSLENAVFVLLGALVTLGIIARVAMVFAP